MSRKPKKKNKKGPTMAELADKHELYEQSVQNVEFEVEFVANTFKQIRNRDAHSVREDFCGTAKAACHWVTQNEQNTAVGVDLDSEVLAWGREKHIAKLDATQATRISLLNQNVLSVKTEPVDTILAMNFSYWCFKTRPLLLEYFKKVYSALVDDGVLFLDAYGGYEAYEELEEDTEHDKFTYIWDQGHYDPYSGHVTNYIHFKFPDGSKIKPAFTYEWRLWSLPEIRELLEEAGFKKAVVYSQGWDEELEEETEEFFPVETLDADPGWVVYIAAMK